jgi:hypothetical protein
MNCISLIPQSLGRNAANETVGALVGPDPGLIAYLLPWHSRGLRLLITAFIVFAFGAGRALRALRYSISILGFGLAAIAGVSGRHPVLMTAAALGT